MGVTDREQNFSSEAVGMKPFHCFAAVEKVLKSTMNTPRGYEVNAYIFLNQSGLVRFNLATSIFDRVNKPRP